MQKNKKIMVEWSCNNGSDLGDYACNKEINLDGDNVLPKAPNGVEIIKKQKRLKKSAIQWM